MDKLGKILGIGVGCGSLDQLADDAIDAVDGRRTPVAFACVNTHAAVVAQSDDVFKSALNDAEHVVADGVGVTIMARFARQNVGPRIVGEQYFAAVMQALVRRGNGRVFFFGSSENVLNRIVDRMKTDFPSLTLCGVHSPPFGDWSEKENQRMIDKINETKPDVLWVGMTAPKQEKWIYENRHALDVSVTGSVGAVFDYFAGTVQSPPDWVRKAGVEALYRLVRNKNAKAIWIRALSIPKFVYLVFRERVIRL